jgi:hypothetical protein
MGGTALTWHGRKMGNENRVFVREIHKRRKEMEDLSGYAMLLLKRVLKKVDKNCGLDLAG